jgi:hypothetical protein
MVAIKINNAGTVLVDTKKGFNVWVDVWVENGEILADWNQYIFYTNCEKDMEIKKFQEVCENFDEATSVAILFYELKNGTPFEAKKEII